VVLVLVSRVISSTSSVSKQTVVTLDVFSCCFALTELSMAVIVLCRYRWAFVGDPGSVSVNLVDKRRQLRDREPTFMPHVLRIARRLSARVCCVFC